MRTEDAYATAEIMILAKHARVEPAPEADHEHDPFAEPEDVAEVEPESEPESTFEPDDEPEIEEARSRRRGAHAAPLASKDAASAERPPRRTNKANAPTKAAAQSQQDNLDAATVGSSAALISICTIISRVTGFVRTWAMAFALGATFLSSSYQIANNLPNMLYELVMGGMLTTAFLPVYLSVRRNRGKRASDRYASNLLTLVVLALGVLSIICMVFPSQIIYTQSFYSDQSTMGTATLFFQFFAIQIVFYGASSIISGILNANRDYLWGAIAPVFNNLVVIAAFIAYAYLAPTNPELAIYLIAIGSPLGVFLQLVIQIPGLRNNGIRIRFRLDLHDPALRETASIGIPALFITVCGFVTVSVANAASYSFADNGPSVIAYSRLWFTFPYSFLAIPVATALFTELSRMQAAEDVRGVVRGILEGTSQILFLMIPFAMYLVVFATPLVTLYHIGAFTADDIAQIALYLAVMAVALPFYGVNTYLQMVFSSIRKMVAFSVVTFAGSAAQVAVIMLATAAYQAGYPTTIEWIAGGTIVAYAIGDIASFAYLKRHYGRAFKLRRILTACLHGLLLGSIGAAVGGGICWLLDSFVAPMDGSLVLALAYIVIGGLAALACTFAPAIKLNLPEAIFVTNIWRKLARKLRRSA